jgi:hypothetical protein
MVKERREPGLSVQSCCLAYAAQRGGYAFPTLRLARAAPDRIVLGPDPFLAAFDLPKAVYIATAGAIGLIIDSGRLVTYWWEGAALSPRLLWGLLLFIPLSFVGAKIAERIVERIPQDRFRYVIAAFLCLVGLKLLFFPSAT